jgi:hypothetical protein
MKDVKGILIDPFEQTVTEVEIKDYDYKKIYPLIGADMFQAVGLDEVNAAFIDEEGLFKPIQKFFMIKDYPHPIANKALVLGSNEDGDTVSTTLNLNEVKDLITFRPDLVYVGSDPIPEGTKAQTPFGEAFVVGSVPRFVSMAPNDKKGGGQ